MSGNVRPEFDERFDAFVRARGDHHLRIAVLLTGDPQAAEDLVQASLVKLYRVWPRLDTSTNPDAYLRRIMVNTRYSSTQKKSDQAETIIREILESTEVPL